MDKCIVRTSQAPAAIGPYSQAVTVQVGDRRMTFTSGQIALDPLSGTMVGAEVEAQTRQVIANLAAVLAAAGAGFEHVVKTTIFLASMDDFAKVNEIYAAAFPVDPPARSTVQAARLPRDAKVEIEVVAVV